MAWSLVTASLEHAVHVRVLTLGAALAALVPGWNQVSQTIFALRNFSAQHVDTTLCPAEGLWLRTTLVKLIDGEWILDEFGESVSDLESLTTPIVAPRAIAEVITIAHAELLPPEDLGFDLSDDHFGVLKRAAPPRPADVPAAPGDAEVPAHERDDSAGPREVIVNGHQQSFAGSS